VEGTRKAERAWKLVSQAGGALAIMGYTTLASGQNCAMCYNTAAAAKAKAIQALRSGILVLLIPPALMFIGIFARAFRSKERSSEESLVRADELWRAVDSPAPDRAGLAVDAQEW